MLAVRAFTLRILPRKALCRVISFFFNVCAGRYFSLLFIVKFVKWSSSLKLGLALLSLLRAFLDFRNFGRASPRLLKGIFKLALGLGYAWVCLVFPPLTRKGRVSSVFRRPPESASRS